MLENVVWETKLLVFDINVFLDVFLWVDCFHGIVGPANSWEWNVEDATMMKYKNNGLFF